MKPTEMSLEEIMAEIEAAGWGASIFHNVMSHTSRTINTSKKWKYVLYPKGIGSTPASNIPRSNFVFDTELAAAQAALKWIRARKEGKCTFML